MNTVSPAHTVHSAHTSSGSAAGFSALLAFLVLALAMSLAPQVRAENRPSADAVGVGTVGTVSLLLGKAHLESADNTRRSVRVGTAVNVGDHILTEANGHVHIRFVDDALVSVRPNSSLQITDYQFNAARPDQSIVRFNLVEGVTRSISGEAGRSARDRFRLDTPIAAIGVRGTDFVVSATQRNVRALVNEGAIMIAPYSADCVVGMLGPCQVGGVELMGSSMQIVEVSHDNHQPILRPRPEQELHELLDEDLDALENDGVESIAKETLSDVYQESVTVREVTRRLLASRAPTSPARPRIPTLVDTADVTPDLLRQRQLAWGRFSAGTSQPAPITLAYADARAGRAVTVGNGQFGLFRAEQNGNKRVDDNLGEVSFALDMAQAFHHGESAVEAMSVNDAALRINFGQGTFATSLSLESPSAGTVNFAADGRISHVGYFHNRGASQNIAGAVSTDGREAGYFFDKQLGSGFIQGLTLWGSSQ